MLINFLRSVMDALEKTFHSAFDPEEFQSTDEQIIPLKGCLSQAVHPQETQTLGKKTNNGTSDCSSTS